MNSIQEYTWDYFWNTSNRYVLHIGPTNSGKTYNALKALKNASTGIYLSPLRLLAYEVFEELNASGIKCDLITGEEKIHIDGAGVISATTEIAPTREVDIVVIDECSMLGDPYRGEKWLHAILRCRAKEVHLILNEESEALVTKILTITGKKFEKIKYTRLVPLELKPTPVGVKKLLPNTILVVFSRIDALTMKAYFEKKSIKTSVLYGNLPPEVKKEQMRKFTSGETSICVATDCIGMGLNLPAEHVVFLKMDKFDGTKVRQLNNFEINQISGRAGRFGKFEKGFVGAVTNGGIKLLQKNLSKVTYRFTHTYFGLNFDLFNLIEGKTYFEKLTNWDKTNIIPIQFQNVVQMQRSKKYTQWYLPQMEQMPQDIFFSIISLPVKEENKSYYEKIVNGYLGGQIEPPMDIKDFERLIKTPITTSMKLKMFESVISEIELYLNCLNSRVLRDYLVRIEIDPIKQALIDKISDYLVGNKLKHIKDEE